jgi:thymidine phosphorylase
MEAPLGRAIGNAIETREAIDVLRGGGPSDTRALTLRLGAEMLLAAGLSPSRRDATSQLTRALEDGSAFECFCRMVRAQGGDTRAVEDPRRLPRAPSRVAVAAERAGYVTGADAFELGMLAVALGAGRSHAAQRIDPRVGIELCAKPGERVEHGDPLAVLHVAKRAGTAPFVERARRAFRIGRRAPAPRDLVLARIVR